MNTQELLDAVKRAGIPDWTEMAKLLGTSRHQVSRAYQGKLSEKSVVRQFRVTLRLFLRLSPEGQAEHCREEGVKLDR
jgi:hypothetical protein